MGKQIGHVITVNAIKEQHRPEDDKNDPDHPPGHLDTDENPDNGHGHVKGRLRAGAVIDHLEIKDPVADREDRQQN